MMTEYSRKAILLMIWMGLTLIGSQSFGQIEKKETERTAPRMNLIGTQLNNDSILLEASVKIKREGSWQPIDFEPIKFSAHNDSTTISLGESLTSDKGIATLKVGISALNVGENGQWNFGSIFEGNEIASNGEAELSIKKIGITLSGEKKDTVYSLTLKLFIPGKENTPLSEKEVIFYIRRHFSNLKIAEGTTNENGEVTIECPQNIPGDEHGNIMLIGRVDDLEEYGSVAASITKPWGIPLKESNYQSARTLSTHAPPLWMVIVFAILMTTVWGHYLVIIYKLVNIRKLKIQNP